MYVGIIRTDHRLVVVKVPRWPFDKFKGAEPDALNLHEEHRGSMAIGRTLEEAFMKAKR